MDNEKEKIRKLCIVPMSDRFVRLGRERQDRVTMLITMLVTRGIIPVRTGLLPSFSDVLKGNDSPHRYFLFPLEVTILIVQYYITVLYIDQNAETLAMYAQRTLASQKEQKRHGLFRCFCLSWGDDYCDCCYDYDDDFYDFYDFYDHDWDDHVWDDHDWDDHDLDHQQDFPDGETGEDTRDKTGVTRAKPKAQKGKSRNHRPRGYQSRRGRSGAHQFSLED